MIIHDALLFRRGKNYAPHPSCLISNEFKPHIHPQTQDIAQLDIKEAKRFELASVLERASVDGVEADTFCHLEHGHSGLLIIAGGKDRQALVL